jgi:YfiH family protein
MNWIRPDWCLPPGVQAAISLRSGGVSQGDYASLNPAAHVGDDPAAVSANRAVIRQQLALPAEPVWLNQVHGIAVARADQVLGVPEADASYTRESAVVCVVLTADCLPLLFCGDGGEVIAAAHAGWRGLHAGIIDATVKAMNAHQLQVYLGPAIGPADFEVGDEVREAFVNRHSANADAFVALAPGKWLADIYRLARNNLYELGIDQITGGDCSTVRDPQRFYSYRRDGARTGRMASLIWRS